MIHYTTKNGTLKFNSLRLRYHETENVYKDDLGNNYAPEEVNNLIAQIKEKPKLHPVFVSVYLSSNKLPDVVYL